MDRRNKKPKTKTVEEPQVKRNIQKPNKKTRFSNLDRIDLSKDLNMKRILIKKRKDKEDARKFYENAENMASKKAKNTRKII